MKLMNSAEAALDAANILLKTYSNCIFIGEGVPDPKACFNTTFGLKEKFPNQVFDSPISENGVIGACIGMALNGLIPVHLNMRQDFLLYAMDQIVNNAAKWHSMFGGARSVPLVIKAFTGKGWGSGHQHSQNLESVFAHIPGLKVVSPSSPKSAKGLLIAAAHDPNPVLILEHRWIHHLKGNVPEGIYSTPIGRAETVQPGTDCLVITWGAMVSEAVRATKLIPDMSVEILDLLTLSPMDKRGIADAVSRHKRIIIISESWGHCGIASTIVDMITDMEFDGRVKKITLPDFYPSSSPAITREYYTNHIKIASMIASRPIEMPDFAHDIPDTSFTGPF